MSDEISSLPPSTALPHGLDALTELAMDLRWTWNHCSDALWTRLDPALWALTHHPSEVLQAVSHERLAAALADPDFSREVDRLVLANRQAESAPGWFQQTHPQSPLSPAATESRERANGRAGAEDAT